MEEDQEELASEIARLVDQGLSTAEVAEALGMNRPRVLRVIRAARIRLARTGTRHIRAEFCPGDYATIRILAERAKVDTPTMLRRLAGLVVEEGLEAAARRLGKAGRPKRAYVRRQEA